jgi:hypothetical protein
MDFPARHRTWVATEQNAQKVFRLGDLRLDLRDGRRGGLVLRPGLLDGHPGDLAMFELQLEELDRLPVGGEGPMGNLQLRIEAAELDVTVATEATRERITPRRASWVARRSARAASDSRRMRPHRSISQLAPASSLEGILRVRYDRRKRDRSELAHLLAQTAPAVIRPAERAALGLHEEPEGLLDVGSGDLDRQVVGQGLVNECIQDRVLDRFPPVDLCGIEGILFP